MFKECSRKQETAQVYVWKLMLLLVLLLLKKVKLDDPRFNRSGVFFVLPSLDLQSVKVQLCFSL